MKIKDLENSLGLMESLIDKISHNQEISDLIGYYAYIKNNSGYFFADDIPDDLLKMLESFKCDIERIKEDIENKIHDHGQNLEV